MNPLDESVVVIESHFATDITLAEIADAAPFERTDERFDGHTGMGGFETWIPVRS